MRKKRKKKERGKVEMVEKGAWLMAVASYNFGHARADIANSSVVRFKE